MSSRFDRDIAVRAGADGHLEANVDRGWWVMRGPNGGFVAAVVVRALEAAVADPARQARSLTVHYLAPPVEGPVHIEARVERAGRSLTTVSARLHQEGKLVALALGSFSTPREALAFDETVMPEVAPPDRCPRMESRIPVHERYEQRHALGTPPFSGGDRALTGGWIRLSEGPRAPDAALLAAYSDAFPPAVFSRMDARTLAGGVPTVDLTVHFRAPLAAAIAADAYTLCVFRSRLSREGFMEEDGELWSADGLLLAQSRQLAVVF